MELIGGPGSSAAQAKEKGEGRWFGPSVRELGRSGGDGGAGCGAAQVGPGKGGRAGVG